MRDAAMAQVDGFRFAAVEAGIKKRGGLDLGLIVADEPVPVAAAFTRNLVRAYPVHLSEERVLASGGLARALLVNSGNANACSGEPGAEAARATTLAVAELLGASPLHVLPASTGVIGQALPSDKVLAVLPALVAGLGVDSAPFAHAIMTTDRWEKVAETEVDGEDAAGRPKKAKVVCIGKGAGMFHPDVALAGELPQPSGEGFSDMDLSGLHATMLVYILTDAASDAATLRAALDSAVDRTFNAATVDGDTSTNDSVYLLASGKSGVELDVDQLTSALLEVCGKVARSMVRDGEGAEHAVDIVVRGLESDSAAREVARTVATSPLVKTAMTGRDANWGRLLAAAGRAGVPFEPSKASVYIGGVCICENGLPREAEADRAASAVMQQAEYDIVLVLGDGPGEFTYVTSDLGHGYVDVNAGYRT